MTNHGSKVLVSALVEQCLRHLIVTFFGSNVKRCVEVVRGAVRRCAMLQQQNHVVDVTESRCYV